MSGLPLTTYLDAAMASVQTVMMELHDWEDAPEYVINAYCEMEQAFARISRARKMLR